MSIIIPVTAGMFFYTLFWILLQDPSSLRNPLKQRRDVDPECNLIYRLNYKHPEQNHGSFKGYRLIQYRHHYVMKICGFPIPDPNPPDCRCPN